MGIIMRTTYVHSMCRAILVLKARPRYGYIPAEENDPFTHITFKLLDEMLVAARPTNLLNVFPFSEWPFMYLP